MIYHTAEKITKWYIKQNLLTSDEFEVYVYYFDLLLEKLFYNTMLLIIACIFNVVTITVAYYGGFIPFRYMAGGYHAKSERDCILLTWTIYGLSMLIVVAYEAMQISLKTILPVFFIILSTGMVILYAPVDSMNKPVSLQRKKLMKFCCIFYECILLVIVKTAIIFGMDVVAFSIALGNLIAGISLVVGKKEKKDE